MQVIGKEALAKGLTDLDKREGYRGPIRHLSAEEIRDYEVRAAHAFSMSPPKVGSAVKKTVMKVDSVVQGLVTKVDDEKEPGFHSTGKRDGLSSAKGDEMARKPDKEAPYYAARVKKPSSVLKSGDVVLVRVLKKYGDGENFIWQVALEQTPMAQGALVCLNPETGEVKAMLGGVV